MEAKVIISKEATVTHISQVQGVGVFCGLDNGSGKVNGTATLKMFGSFLKI